MDWHWLMGPFCLTKAVLAGGCAAEPSLARGDPLGTDLHLKCPYALVLRQINLGMGGQIYVRRQLYLEMAYALVPWRDSSSGIMCSSLCGFLLTDMIYAYKVFCYCYYYPKLWISLRNSNAVNHQDWGSISLRALK